MATRVSFIISTRNRAEFLSKALANVREYIGPNDELIIVDGASTDGTADLVRANADVVTHFLSEPDEGEAHGFNKGLLLSTGRLIKVLTDDDYFFPDAMQQAIAVMEANPSLEAVVCGGEIYRDGVDGAPPTYHCDIVLPRPLILNTSVLHILDYTYCGIGLLMTRNGVARAGFFDLGFRAVDTDYMARMIELGMVFKYLDIKLYRYFEHAQGGHLNYSDCNRDLVRVMARNKLWWRMLRQQRVTAAAIGRAFNLRAPLVWMVHCGLLAYRFFFYRVFHLERRWRFRLLPQTTEWTGELR